MAKGQSISLKDIVYRLQLSLLEGIQNENQLFAAGSLISRSDYEDVVTERSIANLCGFPLCPNSLPFDRLRKGRYRISLKEHRVYDLHETYMFCSSTCVVNSRAFAGSLQDEGCSVLDSAKVDQIMRLFGNLSLDSEDGLGENGDLGLSGLKIQENEESKVGDVSFEQWIGPSNAIEGYVPQRDRNSKRLPVQNRKEGSNVNLSKPSRKNNSFFNDMDFMSTIITKDEYSISKTSSVLTDWTSDAKLEKPEGKEICKDSEYQCAMVGSSSRKSRDSKGKSKLSIQEVPSASKPCQSGSNMGNAEAEKEPHTEKETASNETKLKPSLKSAGAKKLSRSVTWADENTDRAGSRNLCEVREMEDSKVGPEILDNMDVGDDDDDTMLRRSSAEACAIALSQAAEAVATGDSDTSDAVSRAGIIILPRPDNVDEGEYLEDADMLEPEPEPEPAPLKWPSKPGIPHSDFFHPEDSWYDAPPEEFSLTLSPFATMWMALFAWITSSSLAYIYGRDEIFHEEYLLVNGREYPRKIVLGDGRSSEIEQTLAGCLARVLPALAADLRLPTSVSTLERGMGHLLDTMSFVDALPAFRMKQWQVIAFLFIEALSVCRIPALTSHMTNRRILLPKVLDGANINAEEYDVMKDLVIPLGRAPQFSAQSGA